MRTHTDLGFIREVLDDAQATSPYAAGRRHGVSSTTIRRWQHKQMREHTGWPTPADIAAWRADDAEHAAVRAYNAEQTARWRTRRYVLRGPLLIPAHGTVRRLRALNTLGWTLNDLADRLGLGAARVSQLTAGRHTTVHHDTYTAVTALYAQLSMSVPTHHPAWLLARTRKVAAGKGWAPPLAWDDAALDDPAGRPYRPRAA